MHEFKQSNLEKETNDSNNTRYQDGIRYEEKENAFIKIVKVVYFLFYLV